MMRSRPLRRRSGGDPPAGNAGRVRRDRRGQALVEFALVLIPFLLIVLGILDVGRGIYVYNGVAEAAREIARVTSVHPGSCGSGCDWMPTPSDWSPQMQATVAAQEQLVPGLTGGQITIACTDLANATYNSAECYPGTVGRYVQVTISVPFNVVAFDFLPVQPTLTFTSVSHVQMS